MAGKKKSAYLMDNGVHGLNAMMLFILQKKSATRKIMIVTEK